MKEARPAVEDELPLQPRADFRLRRAQLRCIRMAWRHYENFVVIGPLTPPRLIPHIAAIYAFCRYGDDLADEIADVAEAARRLDAWEEELKGCLAKPARVRDGPHHPVLLALARTVQRYHLPTEPLFELISAFRQDLTVHRFATFDDLRDYSRRSADPVGRLVLRLYGYDNPELDSLSDSICTGLQLANFCQDVGRDARQNRIYIPVSECRQFDVDPVEILDQQPSLRLERLLRFQIVRAYKFLRAGSPLSERVRGSLKISIRLFLSGGMRILDNLQENPLAALHSRVSLQTAEKFRAFFSSLKPAKHLARGM